MKNPTPGAWGLAVALLVLIGLGVGGYLWLQSGRRVSSQGNAVIQRAARQTESWRQVDPALVKYRAAGVVPTGLQEPRGLALTNSGALVVVGDEKLRQLNWAGAVEAEVPLTGPANAVALGADGTRYVGLRDHVETYDATGRRRAQWVPASARSYLTSLAVSGKDVYVADAGQRVVLRYDTQGNLLGRIGQKDPARQVPGLVLPSPHLDVAVGADGLLRVTNTGRRSVEVYDRDGNLKRAWGRAGQDTAGFCGCCNPTDLALLPDGRTVTSEKGLPRVKVYSAAGALESVVAGPDAFTSTAAGMDLAVAADGRVLVLDPPAKVIRVFAPTVAAGRP